MSALIEFDAVCKYYQMGDTTVKAADHITMKIEKGEFVAIVGQSGSGKSTCMNIIGCLDVPTAGTYRLNGRDVGKMSRNELASIRNEMLGFIFQQYNLLPKLNLLENVEVPLVYAGIPRAERHRRAREVLGMLQDLHGQGHTVVLITHDNSIAVQADRIIRLEDGQVVYDGDSRAPEAIVQPTLNFESAEQEGNK